MSEPGPCPFASEAEFRAALAEVCTPRIIARLVLAPTERVQVYTQHMLAEHRHLVDCVPLSWDRAAWPVLFALHDALSMDPFCALCATTAGLWMPSIFWRGSDGATVRIGLESSDGRCRYQVPAPDWFPNAFWSRDDLEAWCRNVLAAVGPTDAKSGLDK